LVRGFRTPFQTAGSGNLQRPLSHEIAFAPGRKAGTVEIGRQQYLHSKILFFAPC
jgi:hypothetical protein